MSDAPALPLIGEPLGSAAVREAGLSAPASWGQLFRSQLFQTTHQLMSAIGEAGAELGAGPEFGAPTVPPEPSVEPGELNRQYQAPGLKFNSPLPASVAQQMQKDQLEANARRDVAERYEGGFFGRLSASAIAGALDPTNLAVSVIPGVGEERVAAVLGLDTAESLASRVAARAVSGATAGIAGQAPLELLRASQDPDWAATDIVPDLTGGALLAGLMHAGVGSFGDTITTRFEDSPEGRLAATNSEADQAATRTAVAQALDGRPVEVRPVLATDTPATIELNWDDQAGWQPALRQASGTVPLPEDEPVIAAAAAAPKEEPPDPEAQLTTAHQVLTEADAAGRVDEATKAEWQQAMTDHDLRGQEIARMQAAGLCEM